VKAVQNGVLVFTMICSFQRPEPEQPLFQRTMPSVPSPNACILVEDALEKKLGTPGLTPELRELILEIIAERRTGPIAIKDTPLYRSSDGKLTQAFWMRAKSIPRYELPFQKVSKSVKRMLFYANILQCILSYMSDLRL
jgi:acyl-CoA thioesterase